MKNMPSRDLWEYLADTSKTIVLYGMGNGADKVLSVCAEKGIAVRDCFASDAFVRGQIFHGMTVKTYSDVKQLYGAENLIVLLSFGTSREEVLENIFQISNECELYAPDVPAFGDGIFDRAFFERHQKEIAEARALLSDSESVQIFDHVLRFKLTGDIRCLTEAESDPQCVMREIVQPNTLRTVADFGAYNGDTVRELLDASGGSIRVAYAFEPDARNYKKLEEYARSESRADVVPQPFGVWSQSTVLSFETSGNRNASVGTNRSQSLRSRPTVQKEIAVDTPDHLLNGIAVDYMKYDVEGSEREALLGSVDTVRAYLPTLMVSLYHRNEDLFSIPLLIRQLFPQYRTYYLRRFRGIPAWDLNLYVKK